MLLDIEEQHNPMLDLGMNSDLDADRFDFSTVPKEIRENSMPESGYVGVYANSSTISTSNGYVPNGNAHPVVRDVNENNQVTRRSSICKPLPIIVVISIIYVCSTVAAIFLILNLTSKCNELEQKITTAQASYVSAQQDPHVCLPCYDLVTEPFPNSELDLLLQREENGTRICCAKTPSQISIVLNLFAKRKQAAKCSQELLNENKTKGCNVTHQLPVPARNGSISAHVLMDPTQFSDGIISEMPIKSWLSDRPSTHLEGIKMSDGRLIIPETGYYFLYSQIGFLIIYENEDAVSTSSQTLFHKIFRYNSIYPMDGNEELLRSEETQCWEKSKVYGRYTSYIGAALKLNKGDEVYIKASHASLVSRKETLSYFGMFLIR